MYDHYHNVDDYLTALTIPQQEKLLDKIHESKEIVKDILLELYSTGSLNIKDLEYHIEELCHVLDIQSPVGPLHLVRDQSLQICNACI